MKLRVTSLRPRLGTTGGLVLPGKEWEVTASQLNLPSLL